MFMSALGAENTSVVILLLLLLLLLSGSATRCCHLDLLQIETQPLVQGMSRQLQTTP
jgi:hypothetical protein